MNLLRMQARRRGNDWSTKRTSALYGGYNSAPLKAAPASRARGEAAGSGCEQNTLQTEKKIRSEIMSKSGSYIGGHTIIPSLAAAVSAKNLEKAHD